ncbi:MAG TPA: PEP-CTERM sorting domain-containing protein [Rhodocyclaceae bacterium]|nr:PEP-CTERM sorting domain-containing protein [Rhodocyclaceae bacterium]
MCSKLFKAMLAAGLLTSAASALASPISLPSGPLFIQYTNAEQYSNSNSITDASGSFHEGNWGIVQVSNIFIGNVITPNALIGNSNAPVFVQGQNGGNQITGIFYGAQASGNLSDGNSTGGVMDLYWQDSAPSIATSTELGSPFVPGKRTAQNAYTGFADPTGATMTFLAELKFVPDCGGPINTICSTSVPSVNGGTAFSFQSVIPGVTVNSQLGAWETKLDGNYFTLDTALSPLLNVADFKTKSSFDLAVNWNGAGDIIGLSSSDPIQAYATPEPGSLALVGLALVGFAFSGRRSRKQA